MTILKVVATFTRTMWQADDMQGLMGGLCLCVTKFYQLPSSSNLFTLCYDYGLQLREKNTI